MHGDPFHASKKLKIGGNICGAMFKMKDGCKL